jgi:hypothetical protein
MSRSLPSTRQEGRKEFEFDQFAYLDNPAGTIHYRCRRRIAVE